jgi:hypothetical protein
VRLLVISRMGWPVEGVVIWSQPASAEPFLRQAVLAIWVTPAGRGLAICTAKRMVLLAPPPARFGIVRAHVAEALLSGVQVQPLAEEAGTKVVSAGTVSVRVRLAAAWLPELVTVRA